MELSSLFIGLTMWVIRVLIVVMLVRVMVSWWILPILFHKKLKGNGFVGPPPIFPLGNISEMKKIKKLASTTTINGSSFASSSNVSHDIHSTVFPHFAQWQASYGKKFIYWLGTEPFLYIADPHFVKKISEAVMGKGWGKPVVFKNDREPMFGDGLVMTEGDDWVRHRHILTPAFNPANLKAMTKFMVGTTTKMLNEWSSSLVNSAQSEIDVEREITATAGDIIAKASFGISDDGGGGGGRDAFHKLRALQFTLFQNSAYVGVPFSGLFLSPARTLAAKRLGAGIDRLFLSIISERKAKASPDASSDLLGRLVESERNGGGGEMRLTTREMVDECKTFFFGGHETTALAISWTLLLLATRPEWQRNLREEIKEVVGDHNQIDFDMLSKLKKMEWVFNEVLRLYPSAPNIQRQAKGDIKVGDTTIPKWTNIWIDIVAMHHDPALWGEDVNEFKPERFENDNIYGGCNHKMGYLPFGFGGRMCIGRNLSKMEYKIVLTLILSRFSISLSPSYAHSPSILLSLRPSHGLPLILKPIHP